MMIITTIPLLPEWLPVFKLFEQRNQSSPHLRNEQTNQAESCGNIRWCLDEGIYGWAETWAYNRLTKINIAVTLPCLSCCHEWCVLDEVRCGFDDRIDRMKAWELFRRAEQWRRRKPHMAYRKSHDSQQKSWMNLNHNNNVKHYQIV